MKTSDHKTVQFPRIKRLTKYFCIIVVLCFFNLDAIHAQDPNNLTSTSNTQSVTIIVPQEEEEPESELREFDRQNMLQKQQSTLQLISNISKVIHDTRMAIIRKIG